MITRKLGQVGENRPLMRVVSLNVGMPREIAGPGGRVLTGIFKSAVEGRRRIAGNRIDGDGQADARYHGGADKAVYAYAGEHYAFWCRELGVPALPPGAFGENLTTEGLLEEAVRVGDRFRVATAELVARGPRHPCFKLGLRHGRADIVEMFKKSGRCGVYFAVAREGEIGAGDAIVPLGGDPAAPTVVEVFRAKR